MKKIAMALLIVMLITTSVVFAQGGKEAVQSAPAADAPVNLRFVLWDKASTQYLMPLVDAYKAKHPNVSFEFVDVAANDYGDKLTVMLSGGDTVDIISVKDIPMYSGMLTRNQIVPLNDLITRDKIDLAQYSGATNELTVDGKLYALPFRSDIWILYYNKDIFDKAGIPYPDNDMTWTEYENLARKLTSGTGANKIYGAHHHTWRSTVQLPTVQDGKNTVVSTDYSFMKPIYDMIIRMQNEGTIMDYGSLRAGNIHYKGVFYNGQIAMLPMGSWFIGTIIAGKKAGETKVNWGIAKYPHPEGISAGTTAGTLTSLAINSKSANKEQAWDFLKFYCGPEGADILAKTGALPAIRNSNILNTFASMEGFPAGGADALQTVTVRLELPMHAKVSAIEQILNEQHELIMTQSVTVDKGLAEATARVKKLLAQ
ncbi:MAG: sugar ABC transporter substrate-binding protein [Sphaerochaetaceae bacterium]